MAENFLTYAETDPNSHITVNSASKASFASLNNNEIAHLSKDKGAAYFSGSFIILFTFEITSTTWAFPQDESVMPIVVANQLGTIQDIDDANGSCLFLYPFRNDATTYKVKISEFDSGTLYQSATAVTLTKGTVYYMKIVRDESVGTYGTIYCYAYSDAARATLVGSVSLALHTSKKDYQYIMPLAVYYTAGETGHATGYIENLSFDSADDPETSVNPIVTIGGMTDIAATTATGNGYIVYAGLSAVTEHGHCWATTVNPTTADSKTTNGAGAVGAFTSAITGLTAGTTYYVRAYATNSYGTSYSTGISFISGDATSITIKGNLKVVGTNLIYVGSDGKSYTLTGT